VVDVLIVCDARRFCRHLAKQLETLGCTCWFASTAEEIRTLIGQHPFRLVLSTRPVTPHGSLIDLLWAPERHVFYCVRVEDGCLWLQALPEISGQHLSVLRPSEFTSCLDHIVKADDASRKH
jgi:hypothetical protein